MKSLYLGCARARRREIGIDAVINARGGLQDLNDLTEDDRALRRDAAGIRGCVERRVRWYGPESKFFRRHRARIQHLIARRDD